MANKLNKVAPLKSMNKTVVSKGAKIYGISNEYQTVDGVTVAVGFTSTAVFVLDYDSKLADTEIMKDMYLNWIMEDELSLDDATDFDEVKIIISARNDGSFKAGNTAYREKFTPEALEDMELKLTEISDMLSGEMELSEEDMMKMMQDQ